MSRTRRAHLSKGKQDKRGGQPQVRSQVAQDAFLRTGAGKHGKSRKQVRANEKVIRRKEYPE
jgi:hypothetical protein